MRTTARPGPRVRRSRGVSLLEMLVALGIFAIIASMVYGTFSRTAGTRAFAERRAMLFAVGRAAISWIERDVLAAGTVGLYPEGTVVLFISAGRVERETLRDDAPVLEVTTYSSLGTTPLEVDGFVLAGHKEQSDQARVVYRLERPLGDAENADRRLARRSDRGGYDLVRYDFRPPRQAELEEAARSIVARGVESVALRFYDGVGWWESWDSRPGAANSRRIPRMVETRITILDPEGDPLTFVSGVVVASQVDAG